MGGRASDDLYFLFLLFFKFLNTCVTSEGGLLDGKRKVVLELSSVSNLVVLCRP